MLFKIYIVTITPKYKEYAGSWSSGPYQIEILARTRTDAIKSAKSQYEDQKTNPAKFTAKLKRES